MAIVVYCKQSEITVSRSVGRCPPAAYCIHMKHGHFFVSQATVVTKVWDSTHEVYIRLVRVFK